MNSPVAGLLILNSFNKWTLLVSGYNLAKLIQAAQVRWLKPPEVLFILQHHECIGFTQKPPHKPPSKFSLFTLHIRFCLPGRSVLLVQFQTTSYSVGMFSGTHFPNYIVNQSPTRPQYNLSNVKALLNPIGFN